MKRSLKQTAQWCLLLAVSLLAACAPVDVTLKPTYQSIGEIKGGGGPLVLASALETASKPDGTQRVQFIYGEIKDTDGRIKGNVVSPVAPASLVRDALQQELLKAGYTVQFAAALPKQVEHGLLLTTASVTLDEVASLVKIEAECKVQVTLELWKQGLLVRKLTYGKNVSDFAVRDREKLHQQLLQKALGAVMKDAIADLITYLK